MEYEYLRPNLQALSTSGLNLNAEDSAAWSRNLKLKSQERQLEKHEQNIDISEQNNNLIRFGQLRSLLFVLCDGLLLSAFILMAEGVKSYKERKGFKVAHLHWKEIIGMIKLKGWCSPSGPTWAKKTFF